MEAVNHKPPIHSGKNFSWSDNESGEEDKEKRKLKEENFSLRKKLESMALDKAALIEATLRYRTERNDFESKIRKEKVKIFFTLRKQQTLIIQEHQKELESMMGRLSVQNVELVSVRAQLSETMDMLNEFLVHLVAKPRTAKSKKNQNGNNEHKLQMQGNNLKDALPSQKSAYESPLKNCSSIANCARVISKRGQRKRGRKFQGFWWSKDQPRNFKCEKCPLRFFLLAHLRRHIRVDHRIPEALERVVTGCRSCGLLFKTREEHQMHVIMIHINDCNVDTRTLVGCGSTKEKNQVEADYDNVDVDIEN